MFTILAAILAAILDFFLKLYFLQNCRVAFFDYNLKYCLLNNLVMCVDQFSVKIGVNVKSLF